MSSDRFDDGDLLDDDGLLGHLRAFGESLADRVDEPIGPDAEAPSEGQLPAAGLGLAEPVEPTGPVTVPLTTEVSRTNRAVWLAAAALLLVAAGFGLGRLWSTGDGSIDSTGSPDADAEGVDDPNTSDDSDDADDQGLPAPGPDAGAGEPAPVAPDAPSTITAADGTALAVIDEPAVLAAGPSPELDHQGDVVARAVVLDLVRQQVFGPVTTREEVVDRLANDGLTITTAYDPSAAELAQAAIAELHPDGDRSDEVAVVTIDNRTGAIVALASSEPTSILVDGLRQPGSAFKPIVLATLFEQGMHADDLVSADGPCSFAVPDGQDATQGGPYIVAGPSEQGLRSLRAITLSSNNCGFVRLGQAAGLDRVVVLAKDLGLTTVPEQAGEFLSLPLGVTEVNGVELAGAYAAFANGGAHRSPWLVTEVVDRDGQVLYRRDPSTEPGRAVLTPETAALMTSVLEDNVISGTGTRAQLSGGHRAAGKTGTTADFIDAWFVGSTARYTTAVWVGDPEEIDLPASIDIPGWSSFGGALPAAVWGRYNDQLHRGLEPEPFPDAPPLEDREPVTLVADNEIPTG